MLQSMRVRNFTAFPDAHFDFGRNLNVVVGENGTGKTHVLKLAYSALRVMYLSVQTGANPTKLHFETALPSMLQGVFRPGSLGKLVRSRAGRDRCIVECNFRQAMGSLEFSFAKSSKTSVSVDALPAEKLHELPIFLPPQELMTIYRDFVSLYDTRHIPFDLTLRDTSVLLQSKPIKGPLEVEASRLLLPLEAALGGKILTDELGNHYLKTPNASLEMELVGEGMRKVATIAHLIGAGYLLEKACIFWDEPEANLNPKVIKTIARTIMDISRCGSQVFIATHSVFLLRELYMLQQTKFKDLDTRCFGLSTDDGGDMSVRQGKTMDDIGDITSLDESLFQSDRYLDIEEELGA